MTNISSNFRALSFTGKAVAHYKVKNNDDGQKKDLTLYQLESRDLPFIDKMEQKLDEGSLIPDQGDKQRTDMVMWIARHQIHDMRNSIELQKRFKVNDPTITYLAVSEGKPCGMVSGNIPRFSRDCSEIVFCDNGKKGINEVEGLIAWATNLKGIGVALLGEFFNFCATKGDKKVFLKAEPTTNAVPFYTSDKIGFKPADGKNDLYTITEVSEERTRKLSSLVAEENFENDNDPVYPLEIQMDRAKEVFDSVSGSFGRTDGDNKSVDLNEVVKL